MKRKEREGGRKGGREPEKGGREPGKEGGGKEGIRVSEVAQNHTIAYCMIGRISKYQAVRHASRVLCHTKWNACFRPLFGW